MKKLLPLIFTLMIITTTMAQVSINEDGSDPDASAILDLKSTNKGFLLPRVTLNDASTAAPVTNPAVGLIIYNIDGSAEKGYYYWTGNLWELLTFTGDKCDIYGNPAIDGKANSTSTTVSVCEGSSLSLSSSNNGNWDASSPTFSWTGPNNYSSTLASPGEVTGDFNSTIHAGDYTVKITNGIAKECSYISTITVTAGPDVPAIPGTITGNTSLCENATSETYSIDAVANATEYNWTVPTGASVASGQGTTSVNVNFGTFSGNVSVCALNDCDTSDYSNLTVAITNSVSTPGTITGNNSTCENATSETYSIDAVANATEYNWTVPTGASVASGQGTTSVNVNFGTVGGEVSVRAQNVCDTSDYSNLTVAVINSVNTPLSITGNTSLCENTTGEGYSIDAVANATGYNWTVPTGATVASGQGTTSVTVNFGTVGGDISVRAQNVCDTSDYSNLAVAITNSVSTPGTITGNNSICENTTGETYSIDAVANATEYNWTVPTGASVASGQGTTSVNVNFGTFSGNVSVCALNDCDTSDYSNLTVAITNSVSTPGTITGNNSTCENATSETYSIDAVANATEYNWTVPTGASVASGQGTTSVNVNFGTVGGDVSVRAQNVCDTSDYSNLTVAITNSVSTPGTITGNTSLCENTTGEGYSIDAVANATGYNWTVPTGASVASGQGTTSVNVNFGASSGNVSVCALNDCDTSNYKDLAITVNAQPSIISQPVDLNMIGTLSNYFSLTATGSGLTYQWRVNQGSGFTNIINSGVYSGATNDTLSISDGTGMDGYTYLCLVTGTGCYTVTDTVTLNWEDGPSEVQSATGEWWLDRNLGASRVATASNDSLAYGDLYQWGRATEGHEKRTSSETGTLATTPTPNGGNEWDGKFIYTTVHPDDWLTPQDHTLWDGGSGTNNPCPSGFRVPTTAEFESEKLSWGQQQNSWGAFNSPLKFTAGGLRTRYGDLYSVGDDGYYYISTNDGSNIYATYIHFSSSSANFDSIHRAYGLSVRCIRDD